MHVRPFTACSSPCKEPGSALWQGLPAPQRVQVPCQLRPGDRFGTGSSEDINQGLLIHQRPTSHAHHAQSPRQPPERGLQLPPRKFGHESAEQSRSPAPRSPPGCWLTRFGAALNCKPSLRKASPGPSAAAERAEPQVLGSITAVTRLDESARFSAQTVTPVR